MNSRTLILFLFLIISELNYGQDSLKVVQLENKIENLEYQIQSLENSTDRILNALYFTVGIILASVIGLNIWNWIVQNRKHSENIKLELKSAEEKFSLTVDEKIKNIKKNIETKILGFTRPIQQDIIDLELEFIDYKSKYLEYSVNETELDLIGKYLSKTIDAYNKKGSNEYMVQKALLSLEAYLKDDGFIFHTDVDRYIKLFESDKYKDFRTYTDKILKLLKEK